MSLGTDQQIIAPSPETSNEDIEATGDSKRKSSKRERSFLSRLLWAMIVVLALLAAGIWVALHQARQVPEFYSAVLETDMKQAYLDGQEFERNLVKLQNTALQRHQKPWFIEITQDQVNGWFATDLPQKFPESLPANIEDPRAMFTEDEVRIAFKYTVKGVPGVVVINADVYCTEKSNEIAVQINDVKTGFIPLPVGPWLERVADSIRNAGIPVFWSKTSDTPVAIFSLPDHITTNLTKHVELEAIDLQPGRIVIAGQSVRKAVPKKDKDPKPEHPKNEKPANKKPKPATDQASAACLRNERGAA